LEPMRLSAWKARFERRPLEKTPAARTGPAERTAPLRGLARLRGRPLERRRR